MQPQPQQLDPQVVNLTKAIRQVESGGKVDAKGKSGEYGGYQFMPDTWKAYASEAGVNVPLEQATREQQNEVAYKKIKQWKDQGYNVGQVASMWNAGPGKPDAYAQNWKGVNDKGVAYDTPEYAKKVAEAYQQMKMGGSYAPPQAPHQFTPAPQSGVETLTEQVGAGGGLVQDVTNSFSRAGTRASNAYQQTATGQINPLSGVLQGAGAVAGTVGDLTDAALSNIPVLGKVYEGATELVGGAVQGALNTAPGQVAKDAYNNLSPEAQGNIQAGADILSVIPFFKGLRTLKQGGLDSLTSVARSKVETQASNEIRSSLTQKPNRSLSRAESRGLDPLGTIVKNQDYIPEIIENNGRFIYDSKRQAQAVQQAIDADEQALQNLFESTLSQKAKGVNIGIPIDQVRQKTVKDVLKGAGVTGNYTAMEKALNSYFDSLQRSLQGRTNISLADLNEIKRDIRKAIDFDAVDPTGTVAKEAKAAAGTSLMKQVEETAKKAGIDGIGDLNKKMANNIEALDLLEFLDGRPIKAGGVKDGLIKSVAKTIPGVEGVIDYASRGVPRTATRKLQTKRPISQSVRKGLVQLAGGLGLSGQFQPREE